MKKIKKSKNSKVEKWTEEQYEGYLSALYGMEYIAGFTEGGVKKYKMEIFILNVVIVKYMVKTIGEMIPMSIMILMK